MWQVSTGTKAVFLSPTDALHGDIGIMGEADLLVAFSKSGGSEELLKLLPFAKVQTPKQHMTVHASENQPVTTMLEPPNRWSPSPSLTALRSCSCCCPLPKC